MLTTSRDQQQRAEELFRNRRLKAALQMTLQVEKSLKQALEKAGGYRKAQQRYESQLDRYFAIRERIELDGAADRPPVRQVLQKAENLRARAEETAAEGRYGRAEKTMREAVEMMTRVAEKIREPMMVRAAIEDVRKMSEEIRPQVEAYNDRRVREQYRDALRHLDKGVATYDKGDYEDAAAQVQAARQIMIRVAETVERPLVIEHGLELLRSLADRIEDKVRASGDRIIQREFAGAREQLAKATALYQSGDYEAASVQMEMAERTLARIAHSLGE
jgi:tetratricopeptide (TPR) repeat protein